MSSRTTIYTRRDTLATLGRLVALADRIVLLHTGDAPTQDTISLPGGALRAFHAYKGLGLLENLCDSDAAREHLGLQTT